MRGDAASMRVVRATSVAGALDAYAREPDALVIAGGTDVMVGWNLGLSNDRTVLDIAGLRAWSGVRQTASGLSIGALTTYTQIQRHPAIARRFPLLVEASATIGGVQIQNRGTIGGNIGNASPAGDTFPPLAVYDAVVKVASRVARRRIPIHDVFAGPKQTTLAPGELITAIELPFPRSRPTRQLFRKVGTRAAQAISKTVFAGMLWQRRDGTVREVRLAFGSMAPTVRRLLGVEAFLTGRRPTVKVVRDACAIVGEDLSPIDDVRSTRDYRLEVSKNLVRDLLTA